MSDYTYINSTGTIVADTADILSTVEGEFKSSLGDDLVVTADTPQGVLITQETQARSNFIANNAAIANQINPNLAGGVFLDAICAFLGLEREPATKTIVYGVSLGGVANTFIPAGSEMSTNAGDIFYSVSSVTLSGEGTASVDFQSMEEGEIVCGDGELINIEAESAVDGWETGTNPTSGILGKEEQSDIALAQLRIDTLGAQGSGQMVNISSAIAEVEGVSSFSYLENVEPTEEEISGITMLPHSVWYCVKGGADTDIAVALLNKSDGCAFNGVQSVNVVETVSGQLYNVKFDRPAEIHIEVSVSISKGTNTSYLTITAKEAIIAFVNGEMSGKKGWVVGYNASPFDLAAAIVDYCPGVRIREVSVAPTDTSVFQTTEIDIAINEVAILDESLIYITVV